MWHHRALLRLVIAGLFLGSIPPAATPQAQAHSAAIAGPPAAFAAAPAATAQANPPKQIASTPVPHPEPPPPSIPAKAPIKSPPISNLRELPLAFVPNRGQHDPSIQYSVRGLGGQLFFTSQEVVFAVPTGRRADQSRSPINDITATTAFSISVVRMRYEGAGANTPVVGIDRQPGTVNYLVGSDSTKWHTKLAAYSGIVYQQLYPGIDLHYDGTDGFLKSTYTLAAGANPKLLRWRYQGSKDVQVDSAGNLLILLGVTRLQKPVMTL